MFYFLLQLSKPYLSADVCKCDPGYGNKDCSVDLSDPPVVKGVVGDGICIKGNKQCEDIRITTDGCVDNGSCKIEHMVVRGIYAY